MSPTTIKYDKLKQAMKDALAETIKEQRGLFRDVFTEALEDVALIEAIKEGENTETVSRDDIFRVLEGE